MEDQRGYGVSGCEPRSTVAVKVVSVDFFEIRDDAAVDFDIEPYGVAKEPDHA